MPNRAIKHRSQNQYQRFEDAEVTPGIKRNRKQGTIPIRTMKKTISLGLVLVLLFAYYCDSGYCRDVQLIKMKKHKTLLGGLKPSSQNSAEIESIARFAVLEHNKKQVLIITLFIFIDFNCEQLGMCKDCMNYDSVCLRSDPCTYNQSYMWMLVWM